MKKLRLLAFSLSCILALSGCGSTSASSANSSEKVETSSQAKQLPEFSGLDDSNLLLYVEDSVGAKLDQNMVAKGYQIESVNASYVSKEYLEELSYNSQENMYFGYALSDIDAQFQGERYVFTLGDNGETTVKAYEAYDDTFEKITKNLAVGTGVMLLTVTASALAGGTATSVVLAVSAKSAATAALSSGALAGLSSGLIEYIGNGDAKKSLKTAAASGAEAFKWGAFGGAIAGGISKALTFPRAKPDVPTWRQSEQIAQWKYGGKEQATFLKGKEVPFGTEGGTRPDVIRTVKGHLEAIEVKNYDLETDFDGLRWILSKEISDRVKNLPKGSTQRVMLDVRGRGYSKKFLNSRINILKDDLKEIYPDIPIELIR